MMDNAIIEMTDDPYIENEAPENFDAPPQSDFRRWLFPVLAIVGIVALVTIALARDQTTFDPNTPEGVVQQYLQAIIDERWDDALAVLDPENFSGCRPEDLSSQVWDETFSAVHLNTREGPVRTRVEVQFNQGEGPFGSWSWPTEFVLIERDGRWYLTDDPWPYFQYLCDGSR